MCFVQFLKKQKRASRAEVLTGQNGTLVLVPRLLRRCELVVGLSVSAKRESVSLDIEVVARRALEVRHFGATVAESSGGAASGGEASHLSVLHHRLADPVDAGIVADGVVVGVNADDFVELVGSIRVHPVGIQHTQISAAATNTVFGDRAVVALKLEVFNTLVARFSVNNTLVVRAFAVSSAKAASVDDEALFGFVS